MNEKTLEAVADAIDAARYAHPEYPRDRPMPFSQAHRTDREYAFRLARAALGAADTGEIEKHRAACIHACNIAGVVMDEGQKLKHENERLRLALDALNELHLLLDFEEPLTTDKPWIFDDPSDINDAFRKAYTAVCANRAPSEGAPDHG